MNTTIILKIKAKISGNQLLSVKGKVKYVQPKGFIIDKSTLETSVPARTMYSKPTIPNDDPVAADDVGIIYAIIRAIPAPIIPAIPIDAPYNTEPKIEIVSAPKLIITPAIKSASITLIKTISAIAAREFA